MDDKIDQAKGRAKQALGDLTDDEGLKREGRIDEGAGKAKGFVDKMRDSMTRMIDKMAGRGKAQRR